MLHWKGKPITDAVIATGVSENFLFTIDETIKYLPDFKSNYGCLAAVAAQLDPQDTLALRVLKQGDELTSQVSSLF